MERSTSLRSWEPKITTLITSVFAKRDLIGVLRTKISDSDMDLDTILEDIPEGRESDIGGNTMDILISLKNGLVSKTGNAIPGVQL